METFSALLAICAGNSPVTGEFPAQMASNVEIVSIWWCHQRPVTRSFDVFFDLWLNKRLSKQSWGWWFETLPCPLWCHSNVLPWFKRERQMKWQYLITVKPFHLYYSYLITVKPFHLYYSDDEALMRAWIILSQNLYDLIPTQILRKHVQHLQQILVEVCLAKCINSCPNKKKTFLYVLVVDGWKL